MKDFFQRSFGVPAFSGGQRQICIGLWPTIFYGFQQEVKAQRNRKFVEFCPVWARYWESEVKWGRCQWSGWCKMYFWDFVMCISLILLCAFLRFCYVYFSDSVICISLILLCVFLWFCFLYFSDSVICISLIQFFVFLWFCYGYFSDSVMCISLILLWVFL